MKLGDGHRWPSRTLCATLQVFVLSFTTILVCTQALSCSNNAVLPSTITIPVKFCSSVWPKYEFTLWFNEDTAGNTLSIVLSVPKANRWYGIGFNKAAAMIGSSAVIAWVDATTGTPKIQPYYLGAQSSSGVTPDSTKLKFTQTPQLVTDTDTYYMAFEIDMSNSTISINNQVMAVGVIGEIPTNGVLQQHLDRTSLAVNYQAGTAVTVASQLPKIRETHGILNILGWGIMLPIGAIIARYARDYDPTWFYAHATIQVIGFIFVIAGLATGPIVESKFPGVNVGAHKGLGVFLFVLAVLQISAILIRPKKDAKIRRYWNWGHWWTGRLALFLAAVNIFVGIHLANASTKWKAGYGIIIALILLVVIILETLYWIKYMRKSSSSRLPQTAMQMRDSEFNPSVPRGPPPPPYEAFTWDEKYGGGI